MLVFRAVKSIVFFYITLHYINTLRMFTLLRSASADNSHNLRLLADTDKITNNFTSLYCLKRDKEKNVSDLVSLKL